MTEYSIYHHSLGAAVTGALDDSGSAVRYRGIKYASVAKRWTRSRLLDSYPPTIDARKFGPRCPQQEEPNHTADFGPYLPFEHGGQDDFECLNLNVTCPKHVEGPLPVLVWIHGGSLLFGAGSDPMWEPTPLVKTSLDAGSPIIVVTINYRLGLFGFLAPEDGDDPDVGCGNFGFHDQVKALEWCQRHVGGFGGDPRKVTIGGESAGGCSVHALIAYQERLGEQRYFRRAIMQSGTFAVMGFWDRPRMNQIWASALVELGLDRSEDALGVLRSMPWQKLLGVKALDLDGYGVFTDDDFVSPPFFASDGSFLEHQPTIIDAIMHGDNADEGNIFRNAAAQPGAFERLKEVAKAVLGAQGHAELLDIYAMNDEDVLGIDTAQLAVRLHRIPEDARFYLPSDELVRVWPKAAFYHLAAKSPFRASSVWPNDSFHTLDLLYVFGDFDHLLKSEGLDDHLRLSAEIKTIWSRFICGHDPWVRAFDGNAATFGIGGTTFGPPVSSREWDTARLDRLKRVKKLGFSKIVQIATIVFP